MPRLAAIPKGARLRVDSYAHPPRLLQPREAAARNLKCLNLMKLSTLTLLCLAARIGHAQSTVDIELIGEPPMTIRSSGNPLSLVIRARGSASDLPEKVGYVWRDFRGNPLSPVKFLPDSEIQVTAPTSELGYLALSFVTTDPKIRLNPLTGLRREFGFAFVPPTDRPLRNPNSPFGIVHPDLHDLNMPAWIKTLTWHTTSARNWPKAIADRRTAGFSELPLISGERWRSDDQRDLPATFLENLSARFRAYAKADKSVRFWELGREENLGRRFAQSAYFDNLAAKVAAIRGATSNDGGPIKLIYQIGGRSLSDARAFFASDAAAHFDIVAPHPYHWPDFPTPETWLARFIEDRRAEMQKHGLSMPMWFTEIGAPQNDAQLETMYSGKHRVPGHTRAENAAYLVKTHAIALANGVEKIFWYNYIDRNADVSDVEDHFGLIDYWGHPKPSYAAYVTTIRCIGDKRPAAHSTVDGLQIYRFSSADEHCVVVWSFPDVVTTVKLQSLVSELGEVALTDVLDTVGTQIPTGDELMVDGYPVFLRFSRKLTTQ